MQFISFRRSAARANDRILGGQAVLYQFEFDRARRVPPIVRTLTLNASAPQAPALN